MLLVSKPDRAQLIEVLEGLLNGSFSREEVHTWREGIVAEHGEIDLSISDGFWYFESLAALTIPFSLTPGEDWFIRRRDIEEYVHDLKGIASEAVYAGVTRVRAHQTLDRGIRWPLLMFDQPSVAWLDELGLPPVRGIFDEHRDLVEHAHLFFEGALYVIVRQYDDRAHQVMLLGNDRDEDRLRRFLATLGMD